MSAAEYRIKTVGDFLAIPPEKQADALRDFSTWLDMRRGQGEFERLLSELVGAPGSVKFDDLFIWVGDGIAGLSRIELMGKGGELIATIKCQEES